MRIALECQSPLLQKSLELFLEGRLVSKKSCTLLIRDVKLPDEEEYESFYISNDEGSDLKKPFSKSQLILALEKREKGLVATQQEDEVEESLSHEMSFEILEKRIEMLTKEYQQNILNAVKAFYEK